MQPDARRFCSLAAALLAIATVIGAVGAHALKSRLSADHFEVLQTAVHYQFFHALGLLALGFAIDRDARPGLRRAAWLLFWGVVLFCGSLYAISMGAPSVLGVLTPLGGLAMIVAWCLAALLLARGSGSGRDNGAG